MEDEVFGCFSPVTDKLYIRNRDFRKHLLHPLKIGQQRRILVVVLVVDIVFLSSQ